MKKKVLMLCVFFITITFNSCKEKDSNGQFEGVWKLSKIVLDSPLDVNNTGHATSVLFDVKDDDNLAKSQLVFNEEKTGTIFLAQSWSFMTYSEKENLRFAVLGSTNDDIKPLPITYTLNNNEGTITMKNIVSKLTKDNNTISIKVKNGFEAKDIETFQTTVSQDLTYVFYK